jgi:anthranilate phosphoribosyltransferase
MSHHFLSLLGQVSAGENLSGEEMTAAMDAIMSGSCDEAHVGLFLTALSAKGETAEEVAGAARSMRTHMTPIQHRYERLLDTCGTGGGGSDLFNVSTTAAIVIAAAGVPVAKHGNRSVTSCSGSADVLAELGVNIGAGVPQVERCLDKLGICFCFAPLMHPAMRHVSAVRAKLGVRTIFNILGPLSNPAGASHQLLGAGRPELRPLLASALKLLGVQRAWVVSGEDGLGEMTIGGLTYATEVNGLQQAERAYQPEQFGLERAPLDSLRVSGPAQSAELVRRVLAGKRGVARDIVILNAAAGLMMFDASRSAEQSAKAAAEAINSGAANDLLHRLAELSRD